MAIRQRPPERVQHVIPRFSSSLLSHRINAIFQRIRNASTFELASRFLFHSNEYRLHASAISSVTHGINNNPYTNPLSTGTSSDIL